MQVSNKIKTLSGSGTILRVIVGILVFGSIWGLVEATLGGALHLVHFAYKGAITGGIGMALMATFVVIYRRPKTRILARSHRRPVQAAERRDLWPTYLFSLRGQSCLGNPSGSTGLHPGSQPVV